MVETWFASSHPTLCNGLLTSAARPQQRFADNEPPEEDCCPPRTYKKFKSRRRQRRLGTPRVSDAGLGSRKKTISLRLLAGDFAHATDGFRLFPHSFLGRLLVEAPLFHLAKYALTLHPLLEDVSSGL